MNENRLGFMQGRLSEMVAGKMQSFPWNAWEQEFEIAPHIPINLMEWTLDHERLYENPLLTSAGQKKIRFLSQKYAVTVPSLTADCFMQAPFWKSTGVVRDKLLQEFIDVVSACKNVGIGIIVVPLVDNGSLESEAQEQDIVQTLLNHINLFCDNRLRIAFESDYAPLKLQQFISRLPSGYFGVNFDMGNSAGLGFDSSHEFGLYGDRIINVHVKDRIHNGSTVPLGLGSVDFSKVFLGLENINYQGNFILQTARFEGDINCELIKKYKDMTLKMILANTKK